MAHTRSMPPDDNDGDDEGPFSRSMRWPRKCALTVTPPIYAGPLLQTIDWHPDVSLTPRDSLPPLRQSVDRCGSPRL